MRGRAPTRGWPAARPHQRSWPCPTWRRSRPRRATRTGGWQRPAPIAELTAQRDAADVELSDWTRLANDIVSVIGATVDAAGPELTTITNDLLHTCVGPRWTASITMTKASETAKKEECLVRVIDTANGTDVDAEFKSGGESVLVGEAVSLALMVVASRGQEGGSIVRDESGAALDNSNARGYVAMLRKAATMTGARQVLLVSHAKEVQELCDAQIVVADGKVEVMTS
jgi:exonuclease SbcC